jgi:hypothetical protein
LETVYDNGKVFGWDDFTSVRARLAKQWSQSPLKFDPISPSLKEKIVKVRKTQELLNKRL